MRQKLDDTRPDPLLESAATCWTRWWPAAWANKELDTQNEAFHQMRDLVINAPERLTALTQQLVTVTARVEPSEAKLTELKGEFAESALASVARNVNAARERIAADQAITKAVHCRQAGGRRGGRARRLRARRGIGAAAGDHDARRGGQRGQR